MHSNHPFINTVDILTYSFNLTSLCLHLHIKKHKHLLISSSEEPYCNIQYYILTFFLFRLYHVVRRIFCLAFCNLPLKPEPFLE